MLKKNSLHFTQVCFYKSAHNLGLFRGMYIIIIYTFCLSFISAQVCCYNTAYNLGLRGGYLPYWMLKWNELKWPISMSECQGNTATCTDIEERQTLYNLSTLLFDATALMQTFSPWPFSMHTYLTLGLSRRRPILTQIN